MRSKNPRPRQGAISVIDDVLSDQPTWRVFVNRIHCYMGTFTVESALN